MGENMELDMEIPNFYKNIFKQINLCASTHGYEVFAVGGFVRDLIMGEVSNDIDFIVNKLGLNNPAICFVDLLEKYKVGTNKALYEKFGTAKLEIENRNPECKKIDIKGDVIRRDFTINTLMLDLKTFKIIDSTGYGLNDIQNKTIRSVNSDIDKMLFDDGLRLLRCIRFMTTKNFKIDKDLEQAIYRNWERI